MNSIPIFLDRPPKILIITRFLMKPLPHIVWDLKTIETVLIPERLAKGGRDPGFGAHEGGDVGAGEALQGGDDLDGGGAGADYCYAFVSPVVAMEVSRYSNH
jgi:hypothetical protein